MRARSWARGGATLGAAFLLLTFVGLSLPSAGQAHSLPELRRTSLLAAPSYWLSPAPPPDPRWLTLIHSQPSRASTAQQAASPSINIHLTDGFVAGRTMVAATVMISVTRAGSQAAYATTTPFPDDAGFFYLSNLTWIYTSGGGSANYLLQAGDVVWVRQASHVASMTVPMLSSLAAADTDTVYGTAPISQLVTVYLFPFADPDASYTRTITADASGLYQAEWLPSIDMRPRDTGYVMHAEAVDRRAYTRFVAPFLRAQIGSPDVSGLAAPHSQVSITATDASGTPYAWTYAYASADGSFRTYSGPWWMQGTGRLQPNDRIMATAACQTFSMTLAAINAHADFANGRAWGAAAPNQAVEVVRYAGPLGSGYDALWTQPPLEQVIVTAAASGAYSAPLSLARADYGAASITTPDGHQTLARFAVPYVWIRVGASNQGMSSYYMAWGQVDDPASPITLSIQGPSGYLKDLLYLNALYSGYFSTPSDYADSSDLSLNSGDVITLATLRGVQVALTLPMLTAQAYPLSDTITGLAPPNTRVMLTVYDAEYRPFPTPTSTPTPPLTAGGGGYGLPHTMFVTTTAQGDYQVDLGGMIDITDNATGAAQVETSDGHSVSRALSVVRSCQPRLLSAQVGGNALTGQGPGWGCPDARLRLRDEQGQVKAENTFLALYTYVNLTFFTGTQPIPILPGDTIEIEVPGIGAAQPLTQVVATLIPSLTVSLDAAANTLSGQAPADSVLYFEIRHEDAFQRLITTTVSAQGIYTVSLSGLYTLGAGDRVWAIVSSTGRPQFYAVGVLPLIKVTLYQSGVRGWLPPLTPYTVSLESARPITAQVSGYAGASGYVDVSSYLRPGSVFPTLMPEDTVAITTPQQGLRMSLPFLSAKVNRSTATVSGQAPPHARLQVDFFESYYGGRSSRPVTATASGTYTVAIPELAPLRNQRGTLIYFTPEDDQIRLDFAAAQWHVTLGDGCLNGNAEESGVPITLTLQTQAGALKGSVTSTASTPSGSFSVCFTQTVEPDDRLSLAYPGGSMTFTVPNVTAEHDYARQVVEGQSPPDSPIVITLKTSSYYWEWATRHTLADTAGHFGLDTSDLRLSLGLTGYATHTDEAGNTTQRNFSILGIRFYLPLIARNR